MAGEKPAARLTDMHVCPAMNGPMPHVGGPIAGVGCPTVLIGSLPAARVSDFAICVGPPDPIVKGSASVFIGGMPAARMGDQCAHGGMIVFGWPTVLIGDAAGGGGGGAAAAAPPVSPACAKLADARDMAVLANHTYGEDPTLPPTYRYLDPATPAGKAELAKMGLKPNDVTPKGSGFHAEIFARDGPDGPHYAVAFRGTRPTSLEDWKNNGQQGIGGKSDYYDRALILAKKVDIATDGRETFVGHSLGGGMASAAAVATNHPGTTFNAAGLSEQTAGYPDVPPSVDAYYVPGDVLSGLQDNRGKVLGALTGGAAVVAGPVAGGAAGGFFVGREAIGQPVLPQAYGTRHPLPVVPPADAGFVTRHNPVAKHGMDWVLRGIDQERKQLGCP